MPFRGCGVRCYACCPASTVTIQPPPFALQIPGPAIYCPDQPLAIRQCNPCANVRGRGLQGKIRLSVTGSSLGGDASSESFSEDVLADTGNEDEDFWGRGPYWGPWGHRRWGYGPWGRRRWGYGPWGRRPWGYGPWGRGPWTSSLED